MTTIMTNIKTNLIPYRKIIAGLLSCMCALLIINFIAPYILYSDRILDTTSDLSDTMWRLRWFKSHMHSSSVVYENDTYHPLLGWSPLANSQNNSDEHAYISFNADGIRGSKQYERKKPPGKTRIVVIGDSFTFGEEVSDSETYSAQLEEMIPNAEVLNMAVHGYGLDQMYLRLITEGLAFNPDIVIFAFIDDDLGRTFLSFRDYMKPKFVLKGNDLVLTNVPIIPPDELKKRLRNHPPIGDLFLLLRDRIKYKYGAGPDLAPLIRTILIKTVEETHKHNAIPIFLYLPASEQMINTDNSPLAGEEFVFSICSEMNIDCFSSRRHLVKAFQQGTTYNLESHYEPKTHRIIAEGLARDLSIYPQFNVMGQSTASGKPQE